MNMWFIIACIELLLIFVLLYYVYIFAKKILETEDNVDSAMKILEERYESISKILDRPVFFDSVEVRQVINDIYNCQKAIYSIMLTVGNAQEIEEIEEKNEREEEDEKSEQD
jgi:hypothetical protein